jgi:hypothetical protein
MDYMNNLRGENTQLSNIKDLVGYGCALKFQYIKGKKTVPVKSILC